MRYLLFGASSSLGESDYENGGWSNHLRKYLESKEEHRLFYNLSISGDTSRGLLERIEDEAKRRIRNKPKEEWTIFICMGANDSRVENNELNIPKKEYIENMTAILQKAKNLAGKVIIITGHPVNEEQCNPFKGKYYYLNEKISEYITSLKEIAQKEDIKVIDTFSKIKNHPSDDGLHPNKEGHLKIFELIKELLD